MPARVRPSLILLLFLGFVAGAALFERPAARAAQPQAARPQRVEPQPDEAIQIIVRLTSGRTFTAAVDDRTDQDRLWLRFDRGGISVLRGVAWPRVESAWHDQRILNAAELQRAVGQLRSMRPSANPVAKNSSAEDEAASSSAQDALPSVAADAEPHGGEAPTSAPERRAPTRPNALDVVRSIAIDASIARWSGGVESDGLVLRVLPLGAEGQAVAASGTLEVDLFGDPSGSPTRGQDYRLLGHWVSRLDAEQMTLEGATLRLPFQAVSADFANDLSPYAVVHVRFTAPGYGTFDASTNPVRLRPYNGVRDRRQQLEGTRFFPNERTNRSPSRQADPR